MERHRRQSPRTSPDLVRIGSPCTVRISLKSGAAFLNLSSQKILQSFVRDHDYSLPTEILRDNLADQLSMLPGCYLRLKVRCAFPLNFGGKKRP